MKKMKGTRETKWSHHDDMLVNLKDWVGREVTSLKDSLAKEHPEMAKDPAMIKSFKTAEDLTTRLFEILDTTVDLAERESNRKKKAPAQDTTAN
jgi:hypothetical protein